MSDDEAKNLNITNKLSRFYKYMQGLFIFSVEDENALTKKNMEYDSIFEAFKYYYYIESKLVKIITNTLIHEFLSAKKYKIDNGVDKDFAHNEYLEKVKKLQNLISGIDGYSLKLGNDNVDENIIYETFCYAINNDNKGIFLKEYFDTPWVLNIDENQTKGTLKELNEKIDSSRDCKFTFNVDHIHSINDDGEPCLNTKYTISFSDVSL